VTGRFEPPTRPGEGPEGDRRRIETVEELLAEARGTAGGVRWLRRSPCPFATVSPTEILDIELEDGERISLFAKRLGIEPRHPDKRRSDREALAYERLLGEAGIAAPRYYGTRTDEESAQLELYLEYIADWDLRYQELDHWMEAARALALLHRAFAGRVGEEAFLLSLDREYLVAWAERAAGAVENGPAGLGRRLESLLAGYASVAELLAGQPRTLVHNDLAPKNVLADRSRTPVRICFVDWEVAGAGCGLLDLVHLGYGLDESQGRRLLDSYLGALEDAPVVPRSASELQRVLAAARVHKAFYRIAHPHLWHDKPALAEEWVAEAEHARAAV
jgi:hypothetical protein